MGFHYILNPPRSFWLRNKENIFPILTLIWRPGLLGINSVREYQLDQKLKI